MRPLIFVTVLVAIFGLASRDSYACFCLSTEVPEAFTNARAVFIGQVIAITKPKSNDPKAQLADRLYTVRFKVEKSWKGRTFFQEIIVLSEQGKSWCFSWGPFIEGRKYLVYAEATEGDNLAVLFRCNRTTVLANASQDIKQLNSFQLFPPRIPTKIFFSDFTKSISTVTQNRP
jgi:hypothetical protein